MKRPLQKVSSPLKILSMNHPHVTVIIPVYNDYDRLLNCLQQLANQTYPRGKFDIIIIDNGSTIPVKGQLKNAFPTSNLSVLEEPKPGSYTARNSGILSAQGEIITFTDSDCLPALDWLEKGVQHLLAEPNCGLVGGRIKVFPRDPNKMTAVEFYECNAAFPQEEYINHYHYSTTANLFTFRRILDEVGGFSDTLKSAGDAEWGNRVYVKGYKLVYADDVIISHPARRTMGELYNKQVRIAGGLFDRGLPRRPSPQELLTAFLPPISTTKEAINKFKPQTLNQKRQLAFIVFAQKYIRAWTTLRLYFGAKSNR